MSEVWGGRFVGQTDELARSFTASLPFDRRLYRHDIRGSIAHARMLARQGIISQEEVAAIVKGLQEIQAEIEAGRFPFRLEFEDIHMNIERRLVEKIGPVGGKLHTARSRNDQNALDMHLYFKEEIGHVQRLVREMQAVILHQAEAYRGAIMPGYTHLQRAQPILLSLHLLAYFFMLQRDYDRLADCLRRLDLSPLGAGALAGTSFPIDRRAVAAELDLADIYPNSMDAVSDRDYLVEFLAAASLIMVHLSRLAGELILWASTEFSFVEIDDAFATGSSIMPQKKNPDVAELVRGKAGRVFGSLMGLLTVLHGLPLAYHTDLQEDKERTFDALDTVKACLEVTAALLRATRFRRERMAEAVRTDFSNATDLADYLAKKGIAFREAHEITGKIVRYCLDHGKLLADMTLEELKTFHPSFETDVYSAISPEQCVAARSSEGGTAPAEVDKQLRLAHRMLDGETGWNSGQSPAPFESGGGDRQ
ncbi:MAG TPA: argininosuccinate lyase [Firmicutes bacterium]|nr:argininosuccinate lyase [Bacillota bacterium]